MGRVLRGRLSERIIAHLNGFQEGWSSMSFLSGHKGMGGVSFFLEVNLEVPKKSYKNMGIFGSLIRVHKIYHMKLPGKKDGCLKKYVHIDRNFFLLHMAHPGKKDG